MAYGGISQVRVLLSKHGSHCDVISVVAVTAQAVWLVYYQVVVTVM